MEKKSQIRAYVGLVLVFMIWGSLYVVSQEVLLYISPVMVMFWRFVIAFLALSLIISVKSRSWKDGKNAQGRKTKLDKAAWKYVLLMGILGYAVSVSVQLLGTKYAGSSMASLINSLNPVVIAVIAVPLLHEKLTWNKVLGILLAVFGVYLILGSGGNVNIPGVCLSLVSVALWSLISVLTRRALSQYEPLVVTRAAVGLAAVCEIFFAVIEYFVEHPQVNINLIVTFGLLYLGCVCTGLAYVIWNNALTVLPAGNCSALYPIQPLTSTLMGVILFHEVVGLNFVLGTVCIIAGVLICLLFTNLKKK